MIKFKTGFVEEFLKRNYLGLEFDFDSFDVLFSLCPNSWITLLFFNLKFHAL